MGGVLLLGTSSFATDMNNVKYFAGVGTGKIYLTNKLTDIDTAESTTVDDNRNLIELKAGAVINDKNRVYFSFDKVDEETDREANIYSLNYDYLFDSYKKFIPSIGASYSLYQYKETLRNTADITYDKSEFKLNSNIISLNLGLDYVFNVHSKINVNYSVSISTSGSENVRFRYDSDTYNLKGEIDKMEKLVLSYDYSF